MKPLSLLVQLGMVSSLFAFDNVPSTKGVPADLDSTKVPLFVNLGFDDNRYGDGVDWVRDTLLKGRLNPAGLGNRATFDGTPMSADFYVIGNADFAWSEDPYTAPLPENRPVSDAWRRAYDAGIGVNNHTWTHAHNLYDLDYDKPKGAMPSLLTEIGLCSKYLINIVGIPHSEIFGMRTPYLASSTASLTAARDIGILYDCTMGNGMQGNQPANWAYPSWPGTMEKGWGPFNTVPIEGLWQLPNATYQVSEGVVFSDKGFDSGRNGWPGGATGEEMFEQMKSAIIWAYNKNRAAVDLGLHSDYYSRDAQNNATTSASKFTTGLDGRRSSLIMLLDWIEAELPDARVVVKTDIIRWLRNPVALDDLSRNDALTFTTEKGSGVLTGGQVFADANGSSASISGNKVEVTVNDATENWNIDGYAGVKYPFSQSLDGYKSVRVRYNSNLPLRLILMQDGLEVGSYGVGLATTLGEERTVELPIGKDYFELPRPYKTDADLDLSKVTSIAVVANVMDTTMSGEFSAKVELFGAGSVAIAKGSGSLKKSSVKMANFSATNGVLSLPKSGNYTIELYSANGKLVGTPVKGLFQSGLNRVSWGSTTLAKGVYFARVRGENLDVTLRQAVIR